MRCSSCEPLLDRYVEATLTRRQMAFVAAHVKMCDACAALVTELRVVDALLATTKSVELAPNFTFAVMAEINAIPVQRARSLWIWAVLSFYLIAAWGALSGAYVTFGGRIPVVQHVVSNAVTSIGSALAALSGVVHGLGTTSPIVLALVSLVLFVDVLLAGGVIYFHRSLRPRLATVFSRSEAS